MPAGREARFRSVIAHRQAGLVVAMENVTDPHNIMAVLRTADSVGVQQVFVLRTYDPWGRHAPDATGAHAKQPSTGHAPDPGNGLRKDLPDVLPYDLPDPESREWATSPIEVPRRRARKGFGVANLGARSSSGSVKWIDLQVFEERSAFHQAIRQALGKGGQLIGLDGEDRSQHGSPPDSANRHAQTLPPCRDLFSCDLSGPVALALGNERDGLSPELLQECDARLTIPQVGMARSLNVSVAAAVVLYEALRQRRQAAGHQGSPLPTDAQEALFQRWHDREAAKKR